MEEGVAEMSNDRLLLEDVCWNLGKENRLEAGLGVYENEGGEACGANPLVEKRCVVVETMFCREDCVQESELGEERVGEEADEFVCFASAEVVSDRSNAEKELFEEGGGAGFGGEGEERD